jgi:hypothetical protein
MQLKSLPVLVLLLPGLALSQADPRLVAAIDDIAHAALQQGPIAGISIAVTRGNRTLLRKGYGKSNLELETSTTPETVYHIDSITKNLTSAAIVQLAEQHNLNLDDLVEKYVPEIHAIASAATVRSLMNHTSGIPDYTDLGSKSQNIEAVNFTHQDFLATIRGEKPLFPSGQLWRYDNSGFYLLGAEAAWNKRVDIALMTCRAMDAGHYNGVDLICARSFRYHPFPSFYSRPSLRRRPPKRRSARGDRVSPPAARAWLFPVRLPPLRPASRFWNRAETPPMQAPPLCSHCP